MKGENPVQQVDAGGRQKQNQRPSPPRRGPVYVLKYPRLRLQFHVPAAAPVPPARISLIAWFGSKAGRRDADAAPEIERSAASIQDLAYANYLGRRRELYGQWVW